MAEGDTWVNALIGGVITVVIAGFVPFGSVIGGAVAGYLQGGDRNDGLKVGALAGLIALIPFVLLLFFMGTIFGALGMGAGMGMFGPNSMLFGFSAGFGFVVLVFALVVGLLYIVALSAVGGWLGNYVKYDTDVDI